MAANSLRRLVAIKYCNTAEDGSVDSSAPNILSSAGPKFESHTFLHLWAKLCALFVIALWKGQK